jgi:hypothetical protein
MAFGDTRGCMGTTTGASWCLQTTVEWPEQVWEHVAGLDCPAFEMGAYKDCKAELPEEMGFDWQSGLGGKRW